MPQRNDPETLKIPAYMRHKAIVKRDRQRLLWTAWDRKEAGVKPNSPRALGKVENTNASASGPVVPGRAASAAPLIKDSSLKSLPASRKKVYSPSFKTPAYSSPDIMRNTEISKTRRVLDSALNRPEIETTQTAALPGKFPLAGQITHYLSNINVAIIKTSQPLKTGDTLLIEGKGVLFTQPVDEMQIDRKPVKRAKKGSHIGLKVVSEAAVNGAVYLIDLRG